MFRWVILLLIFVCSISFLALHPLDEAHFGTTSDEGYYHAYALQVKELGRPAFAQMISWYAHDIEARKHPAPVRVGYIATLALLFNILGPSYQIMGIFSTLCFFLFLVLNFFFLRRYFSLDRVLSVMLLLATSPFLLGLSRRALVDMPLTFFWAGIFWLFWECLEQPRVRNYVLWAVFLIGGLLFKEATVLLFPVLALLAVVMKYDYRKKIVLWHVLAVMSGAALIAGLVFLWAVGGWSHALSAVTGVASTHTGVSHLNPYAVYYCSGPWYRYLIDFFLVSPFTVLLTTGYVFYIVARKEVSWQDAYCLLFFCGVYFMFNLFPYSKVVRFVLILEIIFAVFTVKALEMLFKHRRTDSVFFSPLGITSLIALVNILTFQKIFVANSLLDPITYHLLTILGFISANSV